jgi:hypothetical protein
MDGTGALRTASELKCEGKRPTGRPRTIWFNQCLQHISSKISNTKTVGRKKQIADLPFGEPCKSETRLM